MPYRFEPVRDLRAEIRRVAEEQVARAIGHLTGDRESRAEGIHDARKATKRVRALLRLLPADPAARELRARIRDAAASLATAREASALREAADRLLLRHDRALSPPEAHELRVMLHDVGGAHAGGPGVAARMALAADQLREAAPAVRRIRPRKRDFGGVRSGLERSWSQFRARLRVAARTLRSEDLHEWRKRVKDHAYHLRLFEATFPELWKPRRRLAERLGEWIGDEHDFAALVSCVRDLRPPFEERVVALAEGERRRLREKVLRVGRRLAAETPADLVRRIESAFVAAREERRAEERRLTRDPRREDDSARTHGEGSAAPRTDPAVRTDTGAVDGGADRVARNGAGREVDRSGARTGRLEG